MRVAVTGAGGRFGTALVAALSRAAFVDEVLAWDLPDHNLDDPESAMRLVSRNRPDMVVHAAAWTDVDGCARDPAQAMRRNGTATGEMAQGLCDSRDGAHCDVHQRGLRWAADRRRPLQAHGPAPCG